MLTCHRSFIPFPTTPVAPSGRWFLFLRLQESGCDGEKAGCQTRTLMPVLNLGRFPRFGFQRTCRSAVGEGASSPRLRSGQALGMKLAFVFSASPPAWDSRMPQFPFLNPELNSKYQRTRACEG